jgi:uncharacterized OB-fold protein
MRQTVMTVQDTADKPVPIPTQADRPYWDTLRERKVVFSRCTACGSMTQRLPMVCTQCQGESFEWTQVSGRGTIYSYSVARQTWVPAFRDQLPYVVVAVAIFEQPSLVVTTNLVGDYELDELTIGLPVVAEFEPRGEATLLQFRLERSMERSPRD